MRKIEIASITFVVFLFFSFFAYIGHEYNLPYVGSALRYVAGPFFAERITPEQILASYKTDKIKILIVPGHDNDSFGAQFKGIKETQMNAELGQELFEFFQKDGKFEAYATRDIELTSEQKKQLINKMDRVRYEVAKRKVTARKKRTEEIIRNAKREVAFLKKDPLFLIGLALYWAEIGRA